ncbi:MAG: hypothetical protein ACU826_11130 [Gammaproteobacteria bacterium]
MNQRLSDTLDLHFDPKGGSPYWLRRQDELGFSIRSRVQSVGDLYELGPFDLEDLARFPLEDFIPRSLAGSRLLITGETGGATGRPKAAAYFEDEFHAAFVEPFLKIARWGEKPKQGHWLWLGPGGPHIIGKAARRIAEITTGCDGFSVDFDPRWYRILAPESMPRKRYLEHLIGQALAVTGQQSVRYLFSTPVVLLALAERMPESQRNSIAFIYLGGMPVTAEAVSRLGEHFPQAEFLSGYGNTLFGVSHELSMHRPDGCEPVYFPTSSRLIVQFIPTDDSLTDGERLRRTVSYGETGQVVMHRLDQSFFLANVIERDCGVRTASPEGDGIGNPQPVAHRSFTVENGIY